MALPAWIAQASEKDQVDFKVSSTEVLLALIASNQNSDTCCSNAVVLNQEAVHYIGTRQEEVKDWLESAVKPTSIVQCKFRLLGSSKLIEQLRPFLCAQGVVEGSHVPASDLGDTTYYFLPKEGRIRVLRDLPLVQNADSPTDQKIKVLVVDDSDTIRKLLSRIIDEDPHMKCVSTVESPLLAIEAIEKFRPDVVTLDIHMPEMDGVTLLKKILPRFRIPIVMISALSKEDGTYVLDALEAGAVDYIQKPSFAELKAVAPVICEKIRNAKSARISSAASFMARGTYEIPMISPEQVDLSYLIAIGSSTGGTEALKNVLTRLPEKIPPILIVQHIPPVFSRAFADRMNQLCKFEVREAQDGDIVKPSCVLIAPGGKQMKLRSSGGDLKILIDDSEPVNRHKPSVDVLFDSIAELKPKRLTAAILTGMGADGAKGLLKLRQVGATTFAQDEATSVVFGMPKEALKLGGTDQAIPLDQMAAKILNACKVMRKGEAA